MIFLMTGICAYGGQVTLTTALRLVEAAPATAMSYLTIVWGILLGFIVFQEVSVPGHVEHSAKHNLLCILSQHLYSYRHRYTVVAALGVGSSCCH